LRITSTALRRERRRRTWLAVPSWVVEARPTKRMRRSPQLLDTGGQMTAVLVRLMAQQQRRALH
jgi:hypothetical protein